MQKHKARLSFATTVHNMTFCSQLKPLIASLVCGALLATHARAEEPATLPLRIVTFNVEILTMPKYRAGSIQKYRFSYAREKQFERVADTIETLNPDVLNLVEVTHREAVDELVRILHEKGLTEYRGYHLENNDTFSGLDVAVISRIEPDEIEGQKLRTFFSEADDPTWRQSYSFTGRRGDRIQKTTSISRNALYFLTVGGNKLAFLGLHLKSNPQDEYSNSKREAEAEVARRILRAEVLPRGYHPIVLGDINDYDPDVPDRDKTRDASTNVLRNLKDFDVDQDGPELVNVAKLIPRQADRYTSHWDWNENHAHDSDDVYTMIDHVLMAKELMPYVKRVFISHSVADDTTDHYPIVVDLELPNVDTSSADKVAQGPK